MRERQRLDAAIGAVTETERELADNLGLIELGEAEGDKAIVADAEAELARLAQEMARRQVETLLSGEADGNDCYLEVHAGAGGTESQDWAQMLLRMYVRWAERSGFKVETLEVPCRRGGRHQVRHHPGQGRERLWLAEDRIRRAPPRPHLALRQQRRAATRASPASGSIRSSTTTIDIEINESDVRIDTYRSSGAGGQHVNTTDSAVRLTHIPTGIAVACQSERSQHKNRATAWEMLRARLYEARAEEARGGGDGDRKPQRPTSAGATRSAPTCCSPISW